jgi:acetyl-CoA synthetase
MSDTSSIGSALHAFGEGGPARPGAVPDTERVFPPPESFSARAHIRSLAQYRKLYRESIQRPEAFWDRQAKAELVWFKPWKKVLQWKLPDAKWFVGGRLNASANCLDRHLGTPAANKAALIWEGEPAGPGQIGEERTLTYQQLHREVCLFANVLKRHGIEKGDRVIIYLPMVPEAAVAMLACARIGAVHSVVFGGFSAQSVADRIFDCQAKLVVTADGGFRRGAIVPLKKNVDDALVLQDASGRLLAATVRNVIVLRRARNEVHIQEGRDLWWHRELEYVFTDCPAEEMDSEAPLFILYTSGSTGKPKGILHTTGGYLLGAKLTTRLVFDLRGEDVYWCTADVGWVTGHSYVVYGPLANGATVFMYEGAPNFPEPDRFWRMIAQYRVTVLYTAPTAIRAFMKWGAQWPARHDLSSLRLLGTVGEPINPEAWMWYREVIGQSRWPPLSPSSASCRRWSTTRAVPSRGTPAASWSSAGPGPACCGASGATRKDLLTPIGGKSREAISPATAAGRTRTAISGSWGGLTMFSTWPDIASARRRWKAPWSAT